MMKNLLLLKCTFISCVILCFAPGFITAQEGMESILKQSSNFYQKIQEADAYFLRKHPMLDSRQLTEGEERDGEYVKYMRWKHFWQNRLNPDGSLGDPTAYYRRGQGLSRATSTFKATEWKNMGLPGNIGGQVGVGRTTAIEFHPKDKNTFWVSTSMGGIWKTQDGGKTYVAIGENLPTLAVSDVLVDKEDTDIIYAATGDRVYFGFAGIGVMKSTDGGQSWQTTALEWSYSNFDYIYALEADPRNPQVIYAATDAGLFKTTDGFNTVTNILPERSYDVRFKPGDASVLYFTAGNAFYVSHDGGETYKQTKTIFDPAMMRITVSSADPERVYFANNNVLYQSYDSGEAFVAEKNITELRNREFGYVIMSEKDADVLYGGYYYIYTSYNDGVEWKRLTCGTGEGSIHIDNHFAAVSPHDKNSIYFCNDGGLYRLEESKTWSCSDCWNCSPAFEDLSGGMLIGQYYDISNSQQNYQVVSGGTQDNGAYFRNANGQWQFYFTNGDGMVGEIDPEDDEIKYHSFQFGMIRRYVHGKSTCISCNIPFSENGYWKTPYLLDPNNPKIIVAGYKRVYRSTNRGDSWSAVSPELANGESLEFLAIAPSKSSTIYAVYNDSISILYRGKNVAQVNPNWTKKRLPFTSITSIAVDPKDDNRVFLTVGGFSPAQKVYRSDDGGDTWTNISGSLPNVPANVIKMVDHPAYNEAMFVGTDAGVFFKDNSMDDWEEYGELPHTFVRDIEFQYDLGLIRIGTFGRAMFEAFLPGNVCLGANPPDTDGDGVCDLIDICPDGDDLKDDDGDGFPNACEDYCTANGLIGSSGRHHIQTVNLNTLSNTSEDSIYSNFRNLYTTLETGGNYTLEIGLDTVLSYATAYGWIDFNQNKEFEERERVLWVPDFNEDHFAIESFDVPEDAKEGFTRMRVRTVYGGPGYGASPCYGTWGEVEDYSIEIIKGRSLLSPQIEIFPNPSSGDIQFHLKGFVDGQVSIRLHNMQGQLVSEGVIELIPGNATYSLSTSNLAAGIYGVTAVQEELSAIKKWVKL